jgi:hypothetical protein
MLLEAIIYAITPCTDIARRMGFLRESISIISRHRRCEQQWTNHLFESRQIIKTAIKKTSGDRRAIIFGAGLGYDLPVVDLTTHFQEVILVDLVHSWPIRLLAWKNPKIKLITHDVTESLSNLARGDLNIQSPNRFLDDITADLIVSLNILSQLPTLPAAYLEDHFGIEEEITRGVSSKIIQCHIDYLKKFSGIVCLITDIEREIRDADGARMEKFSALQGVAVPWRCKNWLWEIVPLGEESSDYSVIHHVAGISNLSEAISDE